MSEEMLAPPRVAARAYGVFVACLAGATILIGLILATCGTFTIGDVARRAAGVAAIAGAVIWGYAALVRYARRLPPEKMPFVHAVIGGLGPMSFYAVIWPMIRGTSWGDMLPMVAWMVPFMFGTTLIAGGVTRRVGESLHCPKCEYEYAYAEPADAPLRCPECGAHWIGLLKKGRRVRSPRMMTAGIVVCTLGLLIASPVFYMRSLAPQLPTGVLCASVYVNPGSSFGAWEELAKRPLSEGWIRRLAAMAIERRARMSFDLGTNGWFEAMVGAGKMPDDLARQWYHAGWRAELDVPARVKLGDGITAKIRVFHAAGGSSMCLGVMFGGYEAGDSTTPIGRREKTEWAHELDPQNFEGHRDAFVQTLTAGHAGALRVRATYWLVYLPSFMEQLHWQEDGTPLPPTNALWFEKVVVEKAVRVD
jgi:hypothetical protein